MFEFIINMFNPKTDENEEDLFGNIDDSDISFDDDFPFIDDNRIGYGLPIGVKK